MLEVELKFHTDALNPLMADLKNLGACAGAPVVQVDQYFAHPSRNFSQTDEALRIRRIGERNCVTYKGPKIDTATKTRREIELPLSSGTSGAEQFSELLAALGFQPVSTVRKVRTAHHLTWQSRAVEVAVDQVDELGTFVEIETMAAESELDAARDAVLSLARELRLAVGERRSYLEMLLIEKGDILLFSHQPSLEPRSAPKK
jgi:adenylate cyclase class 2